MKKTIFSLGLRVRDFLRRPSGFKSRRNLRFGEDVRISRGSHLIGDYTFLGAGCRIGPARVQIGRYCSVGPECVIGPNQHPFSHASTSAVFYSSSWGAKLDMRTQNNSAAVAIGHDVWIGMRSILMPGIKVGNGAVIGAGSIVTRDVPAYAIYAGIPAREIGRRFEEGLVESIERSRWFDRDPRELNVEGFLEDYLGQGLLK